MSFMEPTAPGSRKDGIANAIQVKVSWARVRKALSSVWVTRGLPIVLVSNVVAMMVAISLAEQQSMLAAGVLGTVAVLSVVVAWVACRRGPSLRSMPPRFVYSFVRSRPGRQLVHIRETRNGQRLPELKIGTTSLCGCSLAGGSDLPTEKVSLSSAKVLSSLCPLCREDYTELCEPFAGWYS